MGDEAITITFSCIKGHLDIKKYGTQAFSTNWIANGTVPHWQSMQTSPWNTCQKKELRTIIVSCNIVLSSSEYFRYNPHFLLRFTSGLLACSILISSVLAACRYMTLEGILIKAICHVDLSSCPAAQKILLDQHTCTCYNRTLHMLKLLKLHFC